MKFYRTAFMAIALTGLASGAWAENNVSVPADSRLTPSEMKMNSEIATNMPADQIKQIQSKLKDEGYRVSADGLWGPQTETAIRQFQSANNLEVTGELNNETIAELDVDVDGGINR